jgi:hypothetical protein
MHFLSWCLIVSLSHPYFQKGAHALNHKRLADSHRAATQCCDAGAGRDVFQVDRAGVRADSVTLSAQLLPNGSLLSSDGFEMANSFALGGCVSDHDGDGKIR